ncbi:MAG: VWA domain-containing protein [Candidatus Binataceae bacterium]|nr:VWA domain-containing protein [Candidatus Binataceae bacterium]
MTALRDRLLEFVDQLRRAEVRISVAETLDAMQAVAAAGFERTRMREALAAALIKDEADRPVFDRTFVKFFGRSRSSVAREPQSRSGARAASGGDPQSAAGDPARQTPDHDSESSKLILRPNSPKPEKIESSRAGERESAQRRAQSSSAEREGEGEKQFAAGEGSEAMRHARLASVDRVPFERYSQLEYEIARDALAIVIRRFRARLGRRLRIARRGRIDFRRTIRAAIQRGGSFIDLRMRARRPRHIDIVLVADISGSVRYAATLMLELMAGVRECFHRVRSFVFIDHLAEAGFEEGHLTMTPALDPYARSDFGRVLGELWDQRGELLGPATLLIIMGDARNNRRTARADLIAAIAHQCRAVYWLNPESGARWNTGDSAIKQYAPHVRAVLPAQTLVTLERALAELV